MCSIAAPERQQKLGLRTSSGLILGDLFWRPILVPWTFGASAEAVKVWKICHRWPNTTGPPRLSALIVAGLMSSVAAGIEGERTNFSFLGTSF